eukprot:3778539-Pleurochrysis_carterae.AAC.2
MRGLRVKLYLQTEQTQGAVKALANSSQRFIVPNAHEHTQAIKVSPTGRWRGRGVGRGALPKGSALWR